MKATKAKLDFNFYVLSDDAYQDFIAGASGGSTRKSASAKLLTDFNISVFPRHFTSLFIEKMYPLRQQIQSLLRQNAKLRKAHDLLLPRLMSNKIDLLKSIPNPSNFRR